jgi:hypothetical protein
MGLMCRHLGTSELLFFLVVPFCQLFLHKHQIGEVLQNHVQITRLEPLTLDDSLAFPQYRHAGLLILEVSRGPSIRI